MRTDVPNFSGPPGSAGPNGSDPGPVFQQQQAQIQQAQNGLAQQGDQYNRDRNQAMNERNQARSDLQQGEATQRRERAQAQQAVEDRWGLDKFRCSDDNPWDQCVQHQGEKQQWLANRQQALSQANSGRTSADQPVNQARNRYQQANSRLQRMQNQAQEFNQLSNQFRNLVNRQNSGDLWSAIDGLKNNWVDVKPLYNGSWLSR